MTGGFGEWRESNGFVPLGFREYLFEQIDLILLDEEKKKKN